MAVMNVKRGTQLGKLETTPQMQIKRDDVQTSSATDMQKALGDQALGDVLNKIADPNWVDPSKRMRTAGDKELGKDAFMKLMLTQMKFQDPTNPMQSHEMAAQLAQFSSLEQLSNIHGTLESMKTQQSPSSNYQALALIGKRVSGDSSKVTRTAGDTKHGISFELLGDAAKVKVTIKDAAGNPVRKIEYGNMKKGQSSIEWNGLLEDGTSARTGEYRVTVEGASLEGKKIYAKTAFGGKITGLNFTAEGPVLLVGSQSVKLSDVKKIEDTGADEAPPGAPVVPLRVNEAATNASAGTGAKQAPAGAAASSRFMQIPGAAPIAAAPVHATVKPENKPMKINAKPAPVPQQVSRATGADNADNVQPAEDGPPPGNIDDVPMARELMAQLEKQK